MYTKPEGDLIIADGLQDFNYKQKKLFLAAHRENCENGEKYRGALIKTCGEGVYNKAEELFFNGDYRAEVFEKLKKSEVSCVTLKSDIYPFLLKNTPAPPLVLYAKGNVNLLKEECFGVVGSRKTNAQTEAECEKIAYALSGHFAVVSGVADGADGAAVRGAAKNGKVIAVIPGGHGNACDLNSSASNLAERNGLTISEFPPRTPAFRYTYVLRNRIIAGLCRGVLVVSAAKKSGALITASYAADYGREVFAFPHSIGITSGEGCNALIKKGATLCENELDIFSVFGVQSQEERKIELDDDESAVLKLLKEEGEVHAERIAELLNKQTYEVAAICSALEIEGLIVRTGGNKFSPVV